MSQLVILVSRTPKKKKVNKFADVFIGIELLLFAQIYSILPLMKDVYVPHVLLMLTSLYHFTLFQTLE